MFSDVVVAGIGETTKSRARTERGEEYRNPEQYFARAARNTLDDAGLHKQDVDGLGVVLPLSASTPIIYPSTLAETLGFTDLSWLVVGDHGGASALELLIQGALAVQSGLVENLLCLGADAPLQPHESDAPLFPRGSRGYERNYMDPHGVQGPNSRLAPVQRLHMEQFDTSLEQIGTIPLVQRFHGHLNPLAYLKDPIEIEDYLNAPLIADPIRLLDCVIPVNGGMGFLLRREPSTGPSSSPSINIQGFGQCLGTAGSLRGDDLSLTGIRRAGETAFERASCRPDDLDFVQLYDDYPIVVLLQLEDLGFCDKGDGGAFLETTSLRYDGDCPLNTSGGQLSVGQSGATGGFVGLLEAVRQLRGQAGKRQVSPARRGLITGLGGISYGRNLQNANVVILGSEKGG